MPQGYDVQSNPSRIEIPDWTNIKPTVIYDFANSTNSPKVCNIFYGTLVIRKPPSAMSGTTNQAMIMRDS